MRSHILFAFKTFALLGFLFAGCKNHKKAVENPSKIERNIVQQISPVAIPDTIELKEVAIPVTMKVFSNEIWIKDFSKPIFEIIDLKDLNNEKKNVELKKGKGPGEIMQLYGFYKTQDKVYVTDISTFKVIVYSYPQLNYLSEYAVKYRPSEILAIKDNIFISLIGSAYDFAMLNDKSVQMFGPSGRRGEVYTEVNPFKNFGELLAFKLRDMDIESVNNFTFIKTYMYTNRVSFVRFHDSTYIENKIDVVNHTSQEDVKISVKGKNKLFKNSSSILAIFHEVESGYCSFVRDDDTQSSFIDIYGADFSYSHSLELTGFTPLPLDALVIGNRIFLIIEQYILTGLI